MEVVFCRDATTVISADPSALNNTVGFVLMQLIMD
jgi:hypothetical protein